MEKEKARLSCERTGELWLPSSGEKVLIFHTGKEVRGRRNIGARARMRMREKRGIKMAIKTALSNLSFLRCCVTFTVQLRNITIQEVKKIIGKNDENTKEAAANQNEHQHERMKHRIFPLYERTFPQPDVGFPSQIYPARLPFVKQIFPLP